MEKIEIKATEDTPEIVLDWEKGVFKIVGSSFPEDAVGFYQPVQEWFQKYFQSPNPDTALSFHLEYFNSASTRQIMDLIILFEEALEKGEQVKIIWQYDKGDELMEDKGREIQEMSEIDIELVEQ